MAQPAAPADFLQKSSQGRLSAREDGAITCVSVRCHPENATTQPNASSESASDLLVTSILSCILATTCAVGVVGNIYVLVVTTVSTRCTSCMYGYIVTLALADLYLPTIPVVVCLYFVGDWHFGDLGCSILFSLNLLTMHASIFILTPSRALSATWRVVRPLDTLHRSRDHRRVATCLVWLVAFFLTLPTTIPIDLPTSRRDGGTKRRCHATWQMGTYKVYLIVLFNTRILAPGVVIRCLYTELARTYWRSQRALVLSTEETS